MRFRQGALLLALAWAWFLLLSVGVATPNAARAQSELYKGTVTGLACDSNGGDTAPDFCTGYLAGHDGTALDVDLALPATAFGPYPLVVVIHGWGGSKSTGQPSGSYPGDAFFTSRGYAVMRYSARGFGKSWGQAHLSRLDVEIADLQALISQVVDDPRLQVLPEKIGVTGASYGGAHSCLIATRPTWTTPAGKNVRVAAVAPIVPWTDLAYGLLPNGRPDDSTAVVGTAKLSYLTALYIGGMRDDPERPYFNYAPFINEAYGRILAGEPYEANGLRDPAMTHVMQELTLPRSVSWQQDWFTSLRQDTASWVPILNIQGWTDDLFPATEGLRLYRQLKAVSPSYPTQLYLGDIGHPRAANKSAEISSLFERIITWFDYYLKGVGAQPSFDITAATTTPDSQFHPSLLVRASDLSQFADRTARLAETGPFLIQNPSAQPIDLSADPLIGPYIASLLDPLTPLLTLTAQFGSPGSSSGITLERPVRNLSRANQPLWYFGQGSLRFTGTLAGTDAQYNVRLWDKAPDGTLRLVDRGTFKYVGAAGSVSIAVPLEGNAWIFPPDHRVVLELSNTDAPFLRPNNLPSSTTIDQLTLELPARSIK